ncbi:hypothetical protein, partial [Streptomyces mirabilis]|uniref:hypothetical protein n=1 Tax=Streptomyces mirabilis TaxID=68239 RepID=UPI0035DE024B
GSYGISTSSHATQKIFATPVWDWASTRQSDSASSYALPFPASRWSEVWLTTQAWFQFETLEPNQTIETTRTSLRDQIT